MTCPQILSSSGKEHQNQTEVLKKENFQLQEKYSKLLQEHQEVQKHLKIVELQLFQLKNEKNPPWLFPTSMFTSDKWIPKTRDFQILEMTPSNKLYPDVFSFVSDLWEKYVPNPYKITKIVAIKNTKLQQIWERKLNALEIRSQKNAFKP